jgi:hypothetical protein
MSKLAKAIIDFINKRVDSIPVKLPCVVTRLNSDSSVNLKVLTKEFDKQTGKYVEQQMFDVAVDFPASYEDSYLRFPVKVGTTGTITVFDNDISGLMNGGNETPVDVDTPRRHNIADVKFKPDFQTQKKTITIDNNAEFRNKDMSVILYPNGKIEIKGTTSEVMDLISKYMGYISDVTNALTTATVATMLGPQTLDPATIATLTAKYALMQSDKTLFDAMKV